MDASISNSSATAESKDRKASDSHAVRSFKDTYNVSELHYLKGLSANLPRPFLWLMRINIVISGVIS